MLDLNNFIDKLDWSELSKNPSAIPFLEKYESKIVFESLCENPNGMALFEKNKYRKVFPKKK